MVVEGLEDVSLYPLNETGLGALVVMVFFLGGLVTLGVVLGVAGLRGALALTILNPGGRFTGAGGAAGRASLMVVVSMGTSGAGVAGVAWGWDSDCGADICVLTNGLVSPLCL